MGNEAVQPLQPDPCDHHQPYHSFVDRYHPDDYRQEEIQALKQAIKAKEDRVVLGMPGIGISNLLRFLVTRTDWGKRKVTFAYIDCEALENCLDLETFFEEIARQFHEQGAGDEMERDVSGYERLRRFILKVRGNPLDRLAIVVNKADDLLAQADDAFYRKLKVLTDLNKRVCYILAADMSTINMVDPNETLFAGRKLFIGPFNKRDIIGAIVEEGVRLEKDFNALEQKQLAYLTGGHPGLLRAVSSATVQDRLDLSKSDGEILAYLLKRGDVKARCHRIWQGLDEAQKGALHYLASQQPDLVMQNILAWLSNFGLIDKHNDEYRLFSPIFARYVTGQKVDTLPEPVRLVGLSTRFINGQEIVEAGKVLRGKEEVDVTRLELRLIACLKQELKIYTKDEIAKYVYCEEEGMVEDSRVEDLVRRVRNKLGSQYIKTHRGKGYEFCG